MRKVCVLAILTLSICLTGCWPPPLPSPKPSYEEYFSDPSDADWDQVEDENKRIWIGDGRYNFWVKIVNQHPEVLNSAAGNFDNFRLEVDTYQVSGSEFNSQAVLFRASDRSNYYYVLISGNRYVAFEKIEDGQCKEITPWQQKSAIRQGCNHNNITIVASGNTFTFFVNDVEVLEATDSSFDTGQVGFSAALWEGSSVHIAFDNLRIYALE